MATLRAVYSIALLCVFVTVGAKALDNDVQRKMELLDKKIDDMVKREFAQQEMIEELTSVVNKQSNKLNIMEEDNKYLVEKISELQSQTDISMDNAESRVRRQILNTSYEGPTAFMSSLGSQCETNLGVNQNIAFKSVLTNLGGAYNPLHGVFTAPRDGVYLFSASLLSDSKSQSGTTVHAAITVNGFKKAMILAISELHQHRDQGSNTLIADLKRGDQVWVKNVDNNAATICGINGYSTFSGYLLYPY